MVPVGLFYSETEAIDIILEVNEEAFNQNNSVGLQLGSLRNKFMPTNSDFSRKSGCGVRGLIRTGSLSEKGMLPKMYRET